MIRENYAQTFRANLDYVAHIHVAGSPRRDFPGEQQEIDYEPVVRAIHRAGYGGFWGQEFLPGDDRYAELKKARELFDQYV